MLRLFRKAEPELDGVPPLRTVSAAHGTAVLDRPDRGVWAVADGIGTRTGDIAAAAAAIEALGGLADGDPDPGAIRVLLGRVNDAVRATRVDPRRSAGASVVALRIEDGHATLLWAGDCRAYRYRDGALELLTRDHSALHELIDAGVPIPARAGGHPDLVTRAVGLGPLLELETVVAPVAPGDRLLLCTRALAAAVPATMIAGRLRLPLAAAAEALADAAASMEGASAGALVAIEIG